MRLHGSRFFAVALIALCAAPASAVTLASVATGQVHFFNDAMILNGTPPPGVVAQPFDFRSYSSNETNGTITLGGGSGFLPFTPPWLLHFRRDEDRGWAAFEIPAIEAGSRVDAHLIATYDGGHAVDITDVDPASFAVPQVLFDHVFREAYAQVPAQPGRGTVITWLGDRAAADILARQGDIFYLGFFLPTRLELQPIERVSDIFLRLDVTAVPLPAAAWLFGPALLGALGIGALRRRRP